MEEITFSSHALAEQRSCSSAYVQKAVAALCRVLSVAASLMAALQTSAFFRDAVPFWNEAQVVGEGQMHLLCYTALRSNTLG